MKKLSSTLILAGFFVAAVFAQNNCGNISPEIEALGTFIPICDAMPTDLPVLSTSSDLPNTSFVIINIDQPATDGQGMMIMGTDADGELLPADLGLTFDQRFALTPVAYDLTAFRSWLNIVLTNDVSGTSCCDYAGQMSMNFCDNLFAAGIETEQDLNTLTDIFTLLDVFSSTSGSSSLEGRLQQVDALKTAIESLPIDCQDAQSVLCYAAGNDKLYEIDETPVIDEIQTPEPREIVIIASVDTGILEYSIDGTNWQLNNDFYGTPAIGVGYVRVASTLCTSEMDYENTNLSVELLYFDGVAEATTNLLTWGTETESSNEAFIIERSVDGTSFTEISRVPGAINSLERKDYSYRDDSPLTDIGYYRLVTKDIEGHLSYSNNVIPIQRDDPTGFSILSIGPNPSDRIINVSITNGEPGEMDYTIYDLMGKKVREGTQEIVTGINNFPIDATGLGTSLYIFTASKGDYVVSAYKFMMFTN